MTQKCVQLNVGLALLYGTECWAIKRHHAHKMSVVETCMLRWMCDNTSRDKVRNEDIHTKISVALIEEKMGENHLRWFGYVRRRPVDEESVSN